MRDPQPQYTVKDADGGDYESTLSTLLIAEHQLKLQRDFLQLISHELKNPLTSIIGYAQLMRRRQAYSESAVNMILTQSARLNRLLSDLVDLAQVESGQLALHRMPADLPALVIRGVEETQILTARHRLEADVPAGPVIGDWDPERLAQVLQNLLGNAVKYASDETLIVARLEASASEVRVAIVDQGPGVPPELLPRLFEPFYRLRSTQPDEVPGLGLGLHISRMLVEAHGGRIWAEPAAGGTAFCFVLPRGSTEEVV